MKCAGPCGRRKRRWECNAKGWCVECASRRTAAESAARTISIQDKAARALEDARRAQAAESLDANPVKGAESR